MKLLTTLALLSALSMGGATALARTKLVTLPERELLVTSLDNAAHPLIVEERELPLQAGTNQIDFSWQGVAIDADSVELEIIGNDDVRIISTGFPLNERALTWDVYSPGARTQRVRVSYTVRGIRQEASYELRLGEDERSGAFLQHLLIANQSGEDLQDALIRAPFLGEIGRSIRDGEVRRLLATRTDDLPVEKLFISRPARQHFAGEDGETIQMVYGVTNDDASGLGMGRLPSGKIRVFSEPDDASPVFLGEDTLPATPPGQEAQATLGTVRDVTLERFLLSDRRTNEKYNQSRRPVLFDREQTIRYTLRNFKDEPVTLRVHETLLPVEWKAAHNGDDSAIRLQRKSSTELLVEIDLPPATTGDPALLTLELDISMKNLFPNEH